MDKASSSKVHLYFAINKFWFLLVQTSFCSFSKDLELPKNLIQINTVLVCEVQMEIIAQTGYTDSLEHNKPLWWSWRASPPGTPDLWAAKCSFFPWKNTRCAGEHCARQNGFKMKKLEEGFWSIHWVLFSLLLAHICEKVEELEFQQIASLLMVSTWYMVKLWKQIDQGRLIWKQIQLFWGLERHSAYWGFQ